MKQKGNCENCPPANSELNGREQKAEQKQYTVTHNLKY